jgi:hypothetical protein
MDRNGYNGWNLALLQTLSGIIRGVSAVFTVEQWVSVDHPRSFHLFNCEATPAGPPSGDQGQLDSI